MTALHLLQHLDVALPCISSSPLCCWKYTIPAGKGSAQLCRWQLWRWTMVIYWILTVRLRHSHTSWLEKQHAAPSPQTLQGSFKADLQAGTHKLDAPDTTFHCITVKYQNQFRVLEEFSELSEKCLQDGWVTKQGSRTRRASLLKDNNVSPVRNENWAFSLTTPQLQSSHVVTTQSSSLCASSPFPRRKRKKKCR